MNGMSTSDGTCSLTSKWTNSNCKEDCKDCEIYKEYEECWEVNNDISIPPIETSNVVELNMDEIERFENMSEKEKANECFTAYYPMAKFIYPRLKYFRNMDKMGYPGTLNSMEEWNDILDKMLFSFDYSINGDEDRFSPTAFTSEEYQDMLNRVDEGFRLFGKYFLNLWD